MVTQHGLDLTFSSLSHPRQGVHVFCREKKKKKCHSILMMKQMGTHMQPITYIQTHIRQLHLVRPHNFHEGDQKVVDLGVGLMENAAATHVM